VRAGDLEALQEGHVAQGGHLRDLGDGLGEQGQPPDHAHVAMAQAVVRAPEPQQEQRQEQDGADDEQDLEPLQRRLQRSHSWFQAAIKQGRFFLGYLELVFGSG